jgi:hypothetical protein
VSWVNRISNLFRRNQVDDELEEELQFHLDGVYCECGKDTCKRF